jgi:two-component system sensor histidine kinase/response regulator
MGGTIGVNSQAGYGATFHCSIPFKLPNTIEIKSTWRRHYANIPILIVDDYKSRGKMLLRQLHSNYSQLATSDQLLEMLTQARVAGNPYKIIIVDDEIQHIQLDEMISLISEEEGYDQTLLMLFLNSTNNRLATKYKEIGYFECVVKPIQPTELTNVLTKCWQEWSSKFQNENTALREFRARVLLVEDNPVSLRILKMLLEQFNCQIDSAGTAKETIDAMMSKEYDVVFLDLGLPDTDGITLAKQIKSLQWKNNRIPLVALTAHATEVDRRRCIEAGMAGYLKKPASSQSLKRLLVNVLFNRSK